MTGRADPVDAGPRRGFTLAEVAVALVLLAVGTLGVLGLARASSADAREAELGDRLLWEVVRVVDSLQAVPGGSGSRLTPFGARLQWAVEATGGWVEAALLGEDSARVRIPVVPFDGAVPAALRRHPSGGTP